MKKIKLLALTLAFCLIASVIPAPVAYAADDETVLYPVEVDFVYLDYCKFTKEDTSWTVKPSGQDAVSIDSEDAVVPTIADNEYEIDFVNSKCDAITTYPTHYDLALTQKGRNITFKINAPAGEYNVFFKSGGKRADHRGGAVSIAVDDQVAGNYNFLTGAAGGETVKLANTVTLTGDNTTRSVTLTSVENYALTIYPAGIVLVPAGAVNAQFYNPDLASNSSGKFTITNAGKISNEAFLLSYEKQGCEFDLSNIDLYQSFLQYTAARLTCRAVVGSKLAFNVWVPENGKYNVTLKSASAHASGGTWDISVDGTKVGSHSFETDVAGNHVLDAVELKAGENTVLMTCTALGSEPAGSSPQYSNNYPAGITLNLVTPAQAETVDAAAVFGDVSAYITENGDTVKFTAFSGIESLDYKEVGFIINDEKIKLESGSVYKTVSVQYLDGSNTKTNYLRAGAFFETTTPANPYLFFVSETVDAGSTVTFQPYAIPVDGDESDIILGETYSVTLN